MMLKPVLEFVLKDYQLPLNGNHGVSHWARVLENGLRLAEETGADVALCLCSQSCTTPVVSMKDTIRTMAPVQQSLRENYEEMSLIWKITSFPFFPEPAKVTLTNGHIRTSRFRLAGMPTGSIWAESAFSHIPPGFAPKSPNVPKSSNGPMVEVAFEWFRTL